MPALIVRELKVGYNGPVIDGLSFEVFDGEFIGIIGPNGSGKTTLIKAILGILKPFSGEVLIYDFPPRAGRKYIAYMPQDMNFEPWFPARVFDVVLMGRYKGGFGYTREDKERAMMALELVGMAGKKDRRIGELSCGEMRRVLFARALVRDGRMLLLDEPFSYIEEGMRERMREILESLRGKKTILLVSHESFIDFDRVIELGR